MENPLLELQEYENLSEGLKKGKGPLQSHWDVGFPKGAPDVSAGGSTAPAMEVSDHLRRQPGEGDIRRFLQLYGQSMAVSGKGSSVLQRRYSWKPYNPSEDRCAAPADGGTGRRGDHHHGRPDGSSPFPLEYLKKQCLTVECGQILQLKAWKQQLSAMGYERVGQVEYHGPVFHQRRDP